MLFWNELSCTSLTDNKITDLISYFRHWVREKKCVRQSCLTVVSKFQMTNMKKKTLNQLVAKTNPAFNYHHNF